MQNTTSDCKIIALASFLISKASKDKQIKLQVHTEDLKAEGLFNIENYECYKNQAYKIDPSLIKSPYYCVTLTDVVVTCLNNKETRYAEICIPLEQVKYIAAP